MYSECCRCPEHKVNTASPVRVGATSSIPTNKVTGLCVEGCFSILPACVVSSQVINANGFKLWRTLTRYNGTAIIDTRDLFTFSGRIQYDGHICFTQTRNKP